MSEIPPDPGFRDLPNGFAGLYDRQDRIKDFGRQIRKVGIALVVEAKDQWDQWQQELVAAHLAKTLAMVGVDRIVIGLPRLVHHHVMSWIQESLYDLVVGLRPNLRIGTCSLDRLSEHDLDAAFVVCKGSWLLGAFLDSQELESIKKFNPIVLSISHGGFLAPRPERLDEDVMSLFTQAPYLDNTDPRGPEAVPCLRLAALLSVHHCIKDAAMPKGFFSMMKFLSSVAMEVIGATARNESEKPPEACLVPHQRKKTEIGVYGAGGIGFNAVLSILENTWSPQGGFFRQVKMHVYDQDLVELHNLARLPIRLTPEVVYAQQLKVNALSDEYTRRSPATGTFAALGHNRSSRIRVVPSMVGNDPLVAARWSFALDCRDVLGPGLYPPNKPVLLKASYDGGDRYSFAMRPDLGQGSVLSSDEGGGYDVVPSYYIPPAAIGEVLAYLVTLKSILDLARRHDVKAAKYLEWSLSEELVKCREDMS